MSNKIQIKRSNSTSVPASLAFGELAWSDVAEKLYIGKRTANDAGSDVSVAAIGGLGAFVSNSGDTITGDLIINGNLSVTGTTTTVNSNAVEIGDAIIELNRDLTTSDTPTEDAGFTINRGSEGYAYFVFDESTDCFTAFLTDSDAHTGVPNGDNGITYTAASMNGLRNIDILGNFTAGGDVSTDGDFVAAGNLSVNTNGQISGTLSVGGQTSLSGKLNVLGNVGASITGNFLLTNGTFVTRGISDVATSTQLSINNDTTTLANDLILQETLTLAKSATINGSTTINNNLTVTGSTTLGQLVIEDNKIISNDSATEVIFDKVNVGGGEIDGTVIGANVHAAGKFTSLQATSRFTSLGISDTATSNKLSITDSLTTLANAFKAESGVELASTLLVNGAATLNSSFDLTGTFKARSTAVIDGILTLGANLVGAGSATSELKGFAIDGGSF